MTFFCGRGVIVLDYASKVFIAAYREGEGRKEGCGWCWMVSRTLLEDDGRKYREISSDLTRSIISSVILCAV